MGRVQVLDGQGLLLSNALNNFKLKTHRHASGAIGSRPAWPGHHWAGGWRLRWPEHRNSACNMQSS